MEINKHMIFSSMYRYDTYFFDKKYTDKQYNREFLALEEPGAIPFWFYLRRRIIKKSLGYSYGITDRETYLEAYNFFTYYKTDTIGAISNILYQVFLIYGRLTIQDILALDNFYIYFNKACDYFEIENRASFLEYFKHQTAKEIDLNAYYSIYEEYPEWIPLTKGNIFTGFDLARAIYITAPSFQLKYISAQEAQEMINIAGEKIVKLFDCWTSFFASYIIGKYCWIAQEPDESCIGPMDESLYSIYGMITQPSKPLAKSGIWQGEDYTNLVDHIEKLIKFEMPGLLGDNYKTDFSALIVQHPELRNLVALIHKYPAVSKYFNRKYNKRNVNLVGEKDYCDALIERWIENQLEPGEIFLASSNVPWPVWLSNKSLYYRKGYFFGKIQKIPLSLLNLTLTFNVHDTTKQVYVYTPVCQIFELTYEVIKDNELASRSLGRKAEKDWFHFFMELGNLSEAGR